jgi:hypothetical protein
MSSFGAKSVLADRASRGRICPFHAIRWHPSRTAQVAGKPPIFLAPRDRSRAAGSGDWQVTKINLAGGIQK